MSPSRSLFLAIANEGPGRIEGSAMTVVLAALCLSVVAVSLLGGLLPLVDGP